MIEKYSEGEKQILANYGIKIVEHRRFIPGIDCLGEKPYGNSDACYGHDKCYGVNGMISLHPHLNPPCSSTIPELVLNFTLFEI